MAEEFSKYHQGWLHAREDGLPFAPYTVTSGVYNPDKTLLSSTIDNLKSGIDENTTALVNLKPLGERFGIPADENAFYIVDKDGNIIAQIDKDGVKSPDFIVPNTASLAQLGSTIGYLTNDNGFYITDLSGNVIFQVDENGAKSIDFKDGYGNSLSTIGELSTYITNLNEQIKLQSTNDTKFVFAGSADSSNNSNIIAQIDDKGVHSVDFLVGTLSNEKSLKTIANDYDSLANTVRITHEQNINQNITDIINIENAIGSIGVANESIPNYVKTTLEATLSNVNLDDSDILYIVDNKAGTADNPQGHIIAQVDAAGITSVDFTLKKNASDSGEKFSSALTRIDQNITDIVNIKGAIGSIGVQDESIPEYVKTTLKNTLSNVNLDDSDAFYIVDNKAGTIDNPEGYIIMKVDAEGVTSTDFTLKKNSTDEGEKFSDALENINQNIVDILHLNNSMYGSGGNYEAPQTNSLIERTKYISSDSQNNTTLINGGLDVDKILMNDTKFVFSGNPDASGNANIIAQIDESGVHGYNFITLNGDLNDIISRTRTSEDNIGDLFTKMTETIIFSNKGSKTIKINN